MAGLDIDTSNPREQRNFGFLMAIAIPVLGMVRWGFHWWREGHIPETLPYGFFAVGFVFLIAALAAPWILRPLLIAWLKLAIGINAVVTHVLLTVVFFGMIVPGRVMMSILGKDQLKRKWDPDAATYWEAPEEQPEDMERYLNQF